MDYDGTIKVNNVFTSFDGEVNSFHQGRVSTFIRLQGCNLRCSYCDTPQSLDKDGGKTMTIKELAKEAVSKGTNKFTITGGEPFLQPDAVLALIKEIEELNNESLISIETNGTIAVPLEMGPHVNLIVDYKADASSLSQAFEILCATDFVKFPIGDMEQFRNALKAMYWVKELHEKRGDCPQFAFSPIHGKVEPHELAQWILDCKLPDVILNLQLHKYVWPDAKKDC